jgi:predicted aconitase
VAWGESNAVVFCNSVLGARTNRYGDFLDTACAIAGRAPRYGLHLPENRRATVVVDASGLPSRLKAADAFWPVLGAWYGRTLGERIGVIEGLAAHATEDRLKALGAASAAFGAVALFHVAGITPEAPSTAAILAEGATIERLALTPTIMREARDLLSTATGEHVDAIAVGCPHFSYEEFGELERLLAGRRLRLPFYVNTQPLVVLRLEQEGRWNPLLEAGMIPVVGTCTVSTRILPDPAGVLLTNSGKSSCYTPSNTGYAVQYGSLADCVASGVAGKLVRDEEAWS